jgi:glycosyltransferase involved in cell wall biosynthesis/2-polyprenyl-3-methyl-5-hydroxy-6-metoxy-1,4-benzoquinol methylase
VPFTKETIRLETSLGGSESALIHLARGLAGRGNTIVVYTRFARGEDDRPVMESYRDDHGIWWFDNSREMMNSIIRARQPEVFVSLRHPAIMQWASLSDCRLRILWNEDLLTTPGDYFASAWQTDLHAFVSDYQQEQYCREIPDLRPLSWATRNPVDMDALRAAADGIEKEPDRLIHISRPERALVAGDRSPLLEAFARLRKRRPNATLAVARYHSMYEGNPNVDAFCRRADELVAEAEGVEYLGNLNKEELYHEIARAQLMLYPGIQTFAETSCIAAIEAQALGTPLICTDIGALRETLHPKAGRRIRGDSLAEGYQEAFVNACVELLEDDDAYAVAQDAGRVWAATYDLNAVAEEWETKILDVFDTRFEARAPAVFDRALWNDDIRAADLVADDYAEGKTILAERADTTNETPQRYAETALSPAHEYGNNQRFEVVFYALERLYPDHQTDELRILDFAGGNGSLSACLLGFFPKARVDMVDYSDALVNRAETWIGEEFEDGRHADRFRARVGHVDSVPGADYDLIVAGEIAEHFTHPEEFLTRLETHARPATEDARGGVVLITVPQGPFGEYMHANSLDWSRHLRGHKFCFDHRDLEAIAGHKDGYDHIHMINDDTARGSLCGHYIAHWRRDGQALGEPDIERKVRRLRPRDRLSVCIIAKDAENDIVRCLKSVDTIADEVWIADTGSRDATMQLAKPYTRNGGDVWSIGTCPDVPADLPPPGDFGWARNQSAAQATGDWILWIDCDEFLENPENVHKFLTDNPFNGYVLRQCHVMKDAPYRFDKPIRLFRREPVGKQAGVQYQCHAAIHEHFQADVNDLIEPALIMSGVDLIHLGYVNERLRRTKCQRRNIPLLLHDRQVRPERELGLLLEAREYCNYAKWEKEQAAQATGDPNPPILRERSKLERGLSILSHGFFDPQGKYWEAAFEVYQDTVRLLGVGSEYLVGDLGPGGEMVTRSLWFANVDHYETYVRDVARRIREMSKLPAIDWDDEDASELDTPVVGADTSSRTDITSDNSDVAAGG